MSESDKCVICLNELNNTNEIVTTPCKHQFHSNCFLKWIYGHRDCPLCRGQIIKNPTEEEEGYLFQLQQRIRWESIVYRNCLEKKDKLDINIEKGKEILNELNNNIQNGLKNLNIIKKQYNYLNNSIQRRNRRTLLFQ